MRLIRAVLVLALAIVTIAAGRAELMPGVATRAASAAPSRCNRRQCRAAPSAGQETEVPDTHEAFRKNMQQEATQEFVV